MDCLSAGSIPVIASDLYVLPYSEVIDWKRVALQIYEDDLAHIMDIVRNVSEERILDMRRSGQFIYEKYFSSMGKIALTALSIINERIFPSQRLSYSEWNDPPQTIPVKKSFVLPMGPPRSQGFTAVVLTYDRMESLFRVLERLSKVPSLAKMVVVWNNQQKDPPPISDWPRLPKPLQVCLPFIRCFFWFRMFPAPETISRKRLSRFLFDSADDLSRLVNRSCAPSTTSWATASTLIRKSRLTPFWPWTMISSCWLPTSWNSDSKCGASFQTASSVIPRGRTFGTAAPTAGSTNPSGPTTYPWCWPEPPSTTATTIMSTRRRCRATSKRGWTITWTARTSPWTSWWPTSPAKRPSKWRRAKSSSAPSVSTWRCSQSTCRTWRSAPNASTDSLKSTGDCRCRASSSAPIPFSTRTTCPMCSNVSKTSEVCNQCKPPTVTLSLSPCNISICYSNRIAFWCAFINTMPMNFL